MKKYEEINMVEIRRNLAKIFFSPRFAEFLVLGLVFLFGIRSISDFDIWYHLKAGEYNFTYWTALRHDIFSFSAPGAEWISHSWLAEAIFYLIYRYVGEIWGLIIFVALSAVLIYFIVLRTAKLRGASSFVSVLLILPMNYLIFEFFVPRPQIFSYLFLVLLIYFLERWRRREDSKIFFLIPVLMLFWANTHASVILGFFIISIYAGGAAVDCFLKNGFCGMLGRLKASLFVFLVSFAVLFVNPNDYKAPAYFFIVAPWNKIWAITEWFSLKDFFYILQARIFALLMVVFLLIYIISQINKFKQRPPNFQWNWGASFFDWSLVLIVSVLPWLSIRHVAYFPIIILPLVAEIFPDFHKILARLQIKMSHFAAGATAIILLIYFAAFNKLPSESVNARVIPVRAVDFIEKHGIKGPIFNQPTSGGYLIWRLWPKERVFVDGRVDVYRGEPAYNFLRIGGGQLRNEDDALHKYSDKLINEYNFNIFLLNYLSGPRETKEAVEKLSFHLMTRHNFRLIFWDSAALILIKNTPENRHLIEKFEYKVISPFISPVEISADLLKEAQKEIERALVFSPSDVFLERYSLVLFGRLFPFENFPVPGISQ